MIVRDVYQQRTWILLGAITAMAILFAASTPAIGGAQQGTATSAPTNESGVAGDDTRPINIQTNRVNIYLRAQLLKLDPHEKAELLFSATNYVTNSEDLTIQLIIEAPSGVDITSVNSAGSGSSQYSRVVRLSPGETQGLSIRVDPHEPGIYEIRGEAVYYFGDDRSEGSGQAATIHIYRNSPPPSTSKQFINRLGTIAGVVTSFTSALPSENTPIAPVETMAIPIRVNVIYAIFDFVGLWLLAGVILAIRGHPTEIQERYTPGKSATDDGFMIAVFLTAIISMSGFTRVVLILLISTLLLFLLYYFLKPYFPSLPNRLRRN